jgi:hypothetical protein
VEPQPRVDRALEAPSKSSYHTQNQPTPSMHRISQIAQFFGQLLTSRESEAAYLEKLNEGIAKGTSWERVTEMIQLENSRKSRPGRQPTLPLNHLLTSLPSSLHPTSLFTPLHSSLLALALALELQAPTTRFARSSILTTRIQNHQTLCSRWIRPSKNEGNPTSIKEGRGKGTWSRRFLV